MAMQQTKLWATANYKTAYIWFSSPDYIHCLDEQAYVLVGLQAADENNVTLDGGWPDLLYYIGIDRIWYHSKDLRISGLPVEG